MKALIGMFVLFGVLNTHAQTNAKSAAPKKYDHAHNSNWQIELGVDSYKDIISAGAAKVNNTNINFDPQKLVSSDTGFSVGIRKNFDLANTFYTSVGASLSLSSHEHLNNISTFSIRRESDVRVFAVEQRFGFSYQVYQNGIYNLILRPFVGVGFNMQQTETTTRVANSGTFFNESQTNTINDFFFTPTIGADLLITESWGVQAKYTQSQINTPSANLVSAGPSEIGEGFDQIHIFSIAAIYSF
jgi:opacity protein-like surface antigen